MATKCILVYTAVAVGPQCSGIVALNDGDYICYGKKGRRFWGQDRG